MTLMDRRSFFALAVGLAPALAMAQTAAPSVEPAAPGQAVPTGPPGSGPAGPGPANLRPTTATPPAAPPGRDRRRMASLSFDEMTPQQQRRVQKRLAGAPPAPMTPEAARRAWDGKNQSQRREAMRRPVSAGAGSQPPPRPPR